MTKWALELRQQIWPRAGLVLAGLADARVFGACLVGAIFVVACSPSAIPSTTSSTTTAVPTATPITEASVRHLVESDSVNGLPVEVHGPGEISDQPVVVMLHGGGWYGGSPASMTPLAEYLAGQGIVVFNSTYRTSSGGFPESFDDVACAIRYAGSRASELSSAAETVSVVAHSAGAHLAAVVVLAGDVFGGNCPVDRPVDEPEDQSVAVSRFVGLSGPYDPTLYALVLAQYFGARLEDDPTPWTQGSPYSYLGGNPDLELLIAHGASDELVRPESSELFYQALVDNGYRATLEILPAATHLDTSGPGFVGELIAGFLSRSQDLP